MDVQVSGSDAARIYRLVEECCEMWDDPPAWQHHAAASIQHLVGGFAGSLFRRSASGACRSDPWPAWSRVHWQTVDASLGDVAAPESQRLFRELASRGPRLVPGIRKAGMALLVVGWFCSRHAQLSSASCYRSSRFFEQFMVPMRAEDTLTAMAFCSDSSYTLLTLHRARAERRFSGRDRAVLAALVCALSARIGVKLATRQHRGRHDLPARQRQVLDSLLAGESEKQVADRLGIGIGTAHDYVKALYRYYGAHSRGELLAYQLRRTVSLPVKQLGRRSHSGPITIGRSAAGRKPLVQWRYAPTEMEPLRSAHPRRSPANS